MYDDPDTQYLHRGMPALSLADAFIDELKSGDPDPEKERFRTTILCAGQHIYEVSGPGDWESFDAEVWASQMVARDDRELSGFFLDMTAFFGWMAMNGLLYPPTAIEILRDLDHVGPPCEARTGLASRTVELLATIPCA